MFTPGIPVESTGGSSTTVGALLDEEDDVVQLVHLVVDLLELVRDAVHVLLVHLGPLLRRHRERHAPVALAVLGEALTSYFALGLDGRVGDFTALLHDVQILLHPARR